LAVFDYMKLSVENHEVIGIPHDEWRSALICSWSIVNDESFESM
jgi:hypothetical protein